MQYQDEFYNEFEWCGEFQIHHIWSIRLFTADMDFCNDFQRDLRNGNRGCKWIRMDHAFQSALTILNFVQKMGKR